MAVNAEAYESVPPRWQSGIDKISLKKNLLRLQEVSVRDLFESIGKLAASIQAIFAAPLHYVYHQQFKAPSFSTKKELRCNSISVDPGQRGVKLVDSQPIRTLETFDLEIKTDVSRPGGGGM